MANQSIKSPTLRYKKQTAICLHKIWQFVDAETTLSSEPNVKYSDRQLNFLFDIAEVLGWLSSDKIGSPNKDYLSALLSNHIKYKAL